MSMYFNKIGRVLAAENIFPSCSNSADLVPRTARVGNMFLAATPILIVSIEDQLK